MAVSFEGRCVIVTGAGNGLGRAHALELGRRGATVVVNDLGGSTDGNGASQRAADHVVAEITAAGGLAVASYDSVSTVDGCRHIAEIALDATGRIDAVIHNAGILRNAAFTEMTEDQLWPVLETHLIGGYRLSKLVWPTMVAQGFGRMVFTSSSSGLWGRPEGANYAMAKAGLFGLCNALALEGEAHGILANAILPVGLTRLAGAPDAADDSPQAQERRAAMAAQWARSDPTWVTPMVVYLASAACDRTHQAYSAVAGRYAQVFVGVAHGWRAPTDEPPTVEDIAAHLGAIEDRSSFDQPRSTFHEIELVNARHPN